MKINSVGRRRQKPTQIELPVKLGSLQFAHCTVSQRHPRKTPESDSYKKVMGSSLGKLAFLLERKVLTILDNKGEWENSLLKAYFLL